MATKLNVLISIAFILVIITMGFPYSALAEGYGTIAGKVIDKNGNPVQGAFVEINDYSYKLFRNTTTDANGSFWFEGVPVYSSFGYDHYKVKATLIKDNKTYGPARSLWFRVYSMQVAYQELKLSSYPPTGYGLLHGYASGLDYQLYPVPATIYLSNGMYAFVLGLKGEEWQFYLPAGDYEVWAERNAEGKTYVSNRYKVTVTSDESHYLSIYMPLVNTTAYHDQPLSGANVVHGTVYEKNQVPRPGATVELCHAVDGNHFPLMTVTSDDLGRYVFNDVKINDVYKDCVVRSTYSFNGDVSSNVSPVFKVYYHNTLKVPHDFPVDVRLAGSTSGSAMITSTPSGATIFIDGKNINATTPCNLSSLKSGPHECSLIMADHFTENFTFEVSTDNTTIVSKYLRPNIGDINIEVTPPDAMVFLNGEHIGNGSIRLEDKPYGQYEYLVKRDGYYDESGLIEIVPGDTVTIHAFLVAEPSISLTYLGYLINNILYIIGSLFG